MMVVSLTKLLISCLVDTSLTDSIYYRLTLLSFHWLFSLYLLYDYDQTVLSILKLQLLFPIALCKSGHNFIYSFICNLTFYYFIVFNVLCIFNMYLRVVFKKSSDLTGF